VIGPNSSLTSGVVILPLRICFRTCFFALLIVTLLLRLFCPDQIWMPLVLGISLLTGISMIGSCQRCCLSLNSFSHFFRAERLMISCSGPFESLVSLMCGLIMGLFKHQIDPDFLGKLYGVSKLLGAFLSSFGQRLVVRS
jgi:hypothetical protein